jgi:4-hydroxybenzoate polyprenyltransferase
VLAAISAVCAFKLSPLCLGLFALAVSLEVAYCELRSVTWLKTLVSGAMVGVGGLAGWAAVAPLSLNAVPFFLFLALWEIGGRNLPNDLADIRADSATDVRTVATTFGPASAAFAIAAVALVTNFALLLLANPWPLAALLVPLGAWTLGVPAVELLREPTSEQATRYFNRASLLPVFVFVVMLQPIIVRAIGG